MVKIFRKIRQKLIDEGNLKKYLIYGFGEILLVVIGILIALQINNASENRKSLNKSHQIIREIKRNAQSNIQHLENQIEEEENVIIAIDIIMDNITNTKIYNDSLDQYFLSCFYWPTTSWKLSGYETLKSYGIDIIDSESLKEAIVNLHEISFSSLAEYARASEGIHFSTNTPLITELFIYQQTNVSQSFEDNSAKPIDYEKVISSDKFKSALSIWRFLRTTSIQIRMTTIERFKELIDLIDEELKKA